jgi:hypothetical protein
MKMFSLPTQARSSCGSHGRVPTAVSVPLPCMPARTATACTSRQRRGLHPRQHDPGDSYLVQDKLLDVARKSGADAVHPDYGFLVEIASSAQAVMGAGLTWIGPSTAAIDSLDDKVKARHIAARANAPLMPGTADPVSHADEIFAFATEHGLPVGIIAAFGGDGRGLKVARTIEEISELFDSATRRAVAVAVTDDLLATLSRAERLGAALAVPSKSPSSACVLGSVLLAAGRHSQPDSVPGWSGTSDHDNIKSALVAGPG